MQLKEVRTNILTWKPTSLIYSTGIMAMKRYGPKEKAAERVPPVPQDQLPDLKASSDIMGVLWRDLAPSQNQDKIKFFITLSVENDDTLEILRRALDARQSDLTTYGETFDMTSDEGKAILGM